MLNNLDIQTCSNIETSEESSLDNLVVKKFHFTKRSCSERKGKIFTFHKTEIFN